MPDTTETEKFPPGQHPSLPPPSSQVGAVGWLHRNLFAGPVNIALTVLAICLIWLIVPPLIEWAFIDAHFGPGSSDRKSTRLNSSHVKSSYAVFCLKK